MPMVSGAASPMVKTHESLFQIQLKIGHSGSPL